MFQKKSIFSMALVLMLVFSGMVFADPQPKDGPGYYQHSVTGQIKYFDSHPGAPSQWSLVGPSENGFNYPNDFASGNFDMDVTAIAGGLSSDLQTIPNGGAGGIGMAGGIANGDAQGAFTSFKFWGKTITLGSSEAALNVYAGGFTDTDAYTFTPEDVDMGIGVGSATTNFATVGGHLEGSALGLAYSQGEIGGIAGQISLDGSLLFSSPLPMWDSNGMTYGVAGQGSIGAFEGEGGALGLGSYELDADINMTGYSFSESYRGIDFDGDYKTEIMGSNVGAFTKITSSGYDHDCVIGAADVDGGFVAGGKVASTTIMSNTNGLGMAKVNGGYMGAGDLGSAFNGSAIGGSYVGITTVQDMNGSIVSSGASMSVNSTTGAGQF